MPSLPPPLKRLVAKGSKKLQPKRTERQYSTGDPRWRRIREMVLHRDPLCVECLKLDLVEPSTDADHKDGNPTNNDYDNLQGLCKSCHSKKTYRETILAAKIAQE